MARRKKKVLRKVFCEKAGREICEFEDVIINHKKLLHKLYFRKCPYADEYEEVDFRCDGTDLNGNPCQLMDEYYLLGPPVKKKRKKKPKTDAATIVS